MSDFLQAVTNEFKDLLAAGLLSVESSSYDSQAFGNAVVVLVGGNLRVRVFRDREEIYAQVASSLDPENWFPLQRVIRAVGVLSAPPEGLLTIGQAAEFVGRYFNDLNSGLGISRFSQVKEALADLERFALKRLLDRTRDMKPM